MDAGVQVRLNPDGGNQLNFREALKLYFAPVEVPAEQDEDEDYDENGENEPRKNVLDDYDYDDDFIDDGEVFEDEVAPTPPNEEEDADFDPATEQEDGNALVKLPVHHGFANFWVNTGNLATKKETTIPQPPSSLGNVVLEHIKMPLPTAPVTKQAANGVSAAKASQPAKQGQGKVGVNKSGEGSQTTGASGSTPGSGDASKKSNQTNTVSGTNNSKSSNSRPSQTKGRVVQKPVIEEIARLAALCEKEFGDKKPKLSDPKVQEQLDVMFRAAISAGVGKLFSDIAKDRRVVALADEVWIRLSFLRVKRANLETLGHALIWSTKEKAAMAMVEKSEAELDKFMRERRGQASAAEGALMQVAFDNEVDSRIYEWYRAKSELQMAKNQLGSRVKSVKKCVGGWVVSLKKTAFQGWSVAEGEIVEAFRRVEEVRIALEKQRRETERQQRELERQRRESEKLEKKRKREEQLAAVAVKRTAVEKGGTAGVAPAGGAGSGATAAARSATTAAVGTGGSGGGSAGTVAGVTVVKPKAKVAKGAGKNGLQGGIAKASGKGPGMKMFANGEKNGVKIVKAVKKDAKGDTKGIAAKTNTGKSNGANGMKTSGVQRKMGTKPPTSSKSSTPLKTTTPFKTKTVPPGKVATAKATTVKVTQGKVTQGKVTPGKVASAKVGPVKVTPPKTADGKGKNGGKSGTPGKFVGRPPTPGKVTKVARPAGKVGLAKSSSAKEKKQKGGPETEVIELD